MSRTAVISTCTLKQRALDFRANIGRIVESVKKAKASGSRYRCGPELDVTGYGCGDHLLEADTLHHAWEAVAEVIEHEVCRSGIMVDVGLPVQHNNVVYNCKLVFLNRKVLLIRPKMMLADDSHNGYQETRWFTPWQKVRQVEDHLLPPCITKVTGQQSVPFGDALLVTRDTIIGIEICEEAWNPAGPHVDMYMAGAEIICNGSGYTLEVGNPLAYDIIQPITQKNGGCYLFANLKGYDGSLGYFAGDSCIAVNGKLLGTTPLNTLTEVEVVTGVVDLDEVLTYKHQFRSRSRCAATSPTYPRVQVDFTLCQEAMNCKEEKRKESKQNKEDSKSRREHLCFHVSLPIEPGQPTAAEQVLEGAACWLWDFLCRSQHEGLLLPLCGDVPDTATAAIVLAMCDKVMQSVHLVPQVRSNLLPLTGGRFPKDAHELCRRLLVTFQEPPSNTLAAAIAQQIGSEHVTSEGEGGEVLEVLRSAQGMAEIEGQGAASIHALQHLHAFRARFLALRAVQGKLGQGGARRLLVLATTPAGERGTRRSSSRPLGSGGHFGDVSVVGHIPRVILREVLQLAKERYKLQVVTDVLTEERKDKEKKEEEVEEDEWSEMWVLHRTKHLGPRALFFSLMHRWQGTYSPAQVAQRVQMFFKQQGARGFTPPGAPSCYMVCTGAQHPARPLLTEEAITWQFKAINDEVKKLERPGHEEEQQQ